MLKRKTRRKSEGGVQITSLMDVMTIILLFLLVNYSETVSNAELPAYVKVPNSVGSVLDIPSEEASVVIAKDRLAVGKKMIGFKSFNREKEKVLDSFEIHLGRLWRKRLKALKNPTVTLTVDRTLNYEMIQEVLNVCTSVGLTKFEFIALKE